MATTKGRIKAISISEEKGVAKTGVPEADLTAGFGVVGDAHAGRGPRQVSLLALESIGKMAADGLPVSPGDFAENLTTKGIDLLALKVGTKLRVGTSVELEITQMGKQCHGRCTVFKRVGDCIMPREGIFARVTRSGRITVGDAIEVVND